VSVLNSQHLICIISGDCAKDNRFTHYYWIHTNSVRQKCAYLTRPRYPSLLSGPSLFHREVECSNANCDAQNSECYHHRKHFYKYSITNNILLYNNDIKIADIDKSLIFLNFSNQFLQAVVSSMRVMCDYYNLQFAFCNVSLSSSCIYCVLPKRYNK